MDADKKLGAISKKVNKIERTLQSHHEERVRRADRERFENLAYIVWGFALATTGLAVVTEEPATIAVTLIFLGGGFFLLRHSRSFR